jgi:hypothetical protein
MPIPHEVGEQLESGGQIISAVVGSDLRMEDGLPQDTIRAGC